MKHDPHTADEQERQMLEHFRQHSHGEPSAQLDAQILAAASAAVRTPAVADTTPGLGARLHRWLFGAGGRQRWPVALAGVACLGIGVSLTWRTVEQAPDAFDAIPSGAPMAPAAARMAPPAAPVLAPQAESAQLADEPARAAQSAAQEQGYSSAAGNAEKKISADTSRQRLGESLAADALPESLPHAARAPAQKALSKSTESATPSVEAKLRHELQRLLKLRRDGWVDEADTLLLQLMRDYPQLDIDAQLRQLEQAQ